MPGKLRPARINPYSERMVGKFPGLWTILNNNVCLLLTFVRFWRHRYSEFGGHEARWSHHTSPSA